MERTFYWKTGKSPELFEDTCITSCVSICSKHLRESEKCPYTNNPVLLTYE